MLTVLPSSETSTTARARRWKRWCHVRDACASTTWQTTISENGSHPSEVVQPRSERPVGGCLGMTGVGEGEWKSGTTRRSGSGLAGKVVGKMIVTVSYRVAGSLVC